MDTEYFITLVFERKPLWDQSCKSYHNRDNSRRLWKEIAEKMNVTTDKVKAKWKGLRDTYRREWQKSQSKMRSSSGKEDDARSPWPMYNSLNFLNDQIIPRESSGNIPSPTASTDVNPENNESDMETADKDETQATVTDLPVSHTATEQGCSRSSTRKIGHRVAAKKRGRDMQSELLNIEQAKLSLFQGVLDKNHKKSSDYDYHFLVGLLPHLKKVRPDRKLAVQLQMQQLLMNELSMYPTDSRYSSSTPSNISVASSPYSLLEEL